MKTIFHIMAALTLALLGGCVQSSSDFTPIGDGLKALGICLVVFGVVGALADLIRSGGSPPDKPEQSRPQKRNSKSSEGRS